MLGACYQFFGLPSVESFVSVRTAAALLVYASVAVMVIQGVENILDTDIQAAGVIAVALPLANVTIVFTPSRCVCLRQQVTSFDIDTKSVVKEPLGITQVDAQRTTKTNQVHLSGACVAHRAIDISALAELPVSLGIGAYRHAVGLRGDKPLHLLKLGLEQATR